MTQSHTAVSKSPILSSKADATAVRAANASEEETGSEEDKGKAKS
jgi:hypothetical protein